MGEKRSCCCGALPSMWWWLLALLGLPLLLFLAANTRQGVVENDLATRASEGLKAANMDWATVNLDQRGRDLQLTGTASSEAERDQAVALAQGIEGVRVVDSLIDVSPPRQAGLSVHTEGGKLILQGALSSQDEIDTLMATAEGVYGAGQVDNRLTIGERVAKADWLAGLGGFLPSLKGLDNAGLDVSAEGSRISGVVQADADKTSLLAQAKQLFGDQLDDQIVVKPIVSASLQAALVEGGKLVLTGNLSTPQQVNALVSAASKRVGADNVLNQLTVNKDATPASWLNAAQKLFGLLPSTQGKLSIDEGTLEVSGLLPNDAEHNAAVAAVNTALAGSGLNLVDRMTVGAAVAQETAQAVPTKLVAEPEPVVAATEPEPTVEDKAATDCQLKLNGTMDGQQVLFETNKAVIKRDSLKLLDLLVGIVKSCSDVIAGNGFKISGHTDSDGDDAYNQNLSQQRADAVKSYFGQAGVDTGLIESVGFGETQPVASNDTVEGRARNRRISFDIKHK